MKLKILLLFIALFFVKSGILSAQSSLDIKGYLDTYYSYFTDESDGFQKYTTTSANSNHFALNVFQIGVHYKSDLIRANGTLHYGDIMRATWSNTFPAVQEANVGVEVFKNWWFDLGFFRTHIGTEGFLPKDNYLTSTGVVTYNEPFYQAGAKIAYEGSEKFKFELWAVNGYNYFLDANSAKSFGILLSQQIGDHTTLTYTNLLGRSSLDDIEPKQFRTYHNFYSESLITTKFKALIGIDYGTQTNTDGINNDELASMYSILASLQYNVTKKINTTFRFEKYNDEVGFISGPLTPTLDKGLELQGYTLGFEFLPNTTSYMRVEGRYIDTLGDEIFLTDNDYIDNRWEFIFSIGTYFEKGIK